MKTCVSYFGNRIPEHAKKDFENIKEHNMDSVVITFSEEDLQFYAKTYIKIVRLAHETGLEVYLDPWGVTRIFAGEAYSNFTNIYPEVRQVLQTGRSAPIACPNNPKTIEFIKKWTDAALDCEPDGIFWDEPHLYLDWEGIGDTTLACFCNCCQQKFYQRYGRTMPKVKEPYTITDKISEKKVFIYEIDDEVQKFRYDTMTEFLGTLAKYVKSKNPKVKNAICFLSTFDEKAGTDWKSIASIPEMDIIVTSAYYLLGNRPMSYVIETAKKLFSVAGNKPVQLWIQLFGVKKEDTEGVRKAIQMAREAGIKNIAVWGYKACSYISHFPSDESEKLWDEIIKEEFKKFL